MQPSFRSQLGDAVKLLVGALTVIGFLTGVVLAYAALDQRLALVEARADDQDTNAEKTDTILIDIKDTLYEVRQDVAVIKSALRIAPVN